MNVVFRTDASLAIGAGHVMRSLTLAEALREKGAICRFVCRKHAGNLADLIRQRGFETTLLPVSNTPHFAMSLGSGPDWLGADWETDAAQTGACISESVIDWLIVDHYAIDVRWENRLRSACRHLMVIDDLADRPHDCDLLLDQNLGRSAADYAGLVPVACTVLAGPKYALLRPEFATRRNYSLTRRATPQLKRLLISMGGVDKDNASGEVLQALKKKRALAADCRITVVMGVHAPWIDAVREEAARMPWTTEVMVNVQDIASLMADSDLAIGAAGISAWERCCLGLPSLTLVLAENQRAGARALDSAGAALLLDEKNPLADELQEKIACLSMAQRLEIMQYACSSITDGSGAAILTSMLASAND